VDRQMAVVTPKRRFTYGLHGAMSQKILSCIHSFTGTSTLRTFRWPSTFPPSKAPSLPSRSYEINQTRSYSQTLNNYCNLRIHSSTQQKGTKYRIFSYVTDEGIVQEGQRHSQRTAHKLRRNQSIHHLPYGFRNGHVRCIATEIRGQSLNLQQMYIGV
jgi:hypothetical protein